LVVIGLAIVVARIGESADGAARAPESRSTTSRAISVVLAIGAVVVGVVLGRGIAYEASHRELGVIGAAVLMMSVIGVVVAMAAVALIATKIRHGHGSRAIATILAAAGLLAASAFGGGVTARALGGTYHDPVVLDALGETTFALDPGALPFVARVSGRADCRSEPDGQTVVDMTALDLGELGPGTLRAMVSLPIQASEPATAEFFIDGGDLPDGSVQPFWRGPVLVATISTDHASGQLAFDGLTREIDQKMPTPESSVAIAAANAWPSTLSGQLTWSCRRW
jgi:hypothetical protein